MYQGKEDIGAIVADIGSTSARIGFAGDDMPRAYIPSVT
jgi:actin-related protein